jgi:hypothetical protein
VLQDVDIFKRLESRTQTATDAVEQVRSGEVWGGVARGGLEPAVKAYTGHLNGRRGIEFTTPVAPHQSASSPLEVRWYLTKTPGVMAKYNEFGEEMACIKAQVSNYQP